MVDLAELDLDDLATGGRDDAADVFGFDGQFAVGAQYTIPLGSGATLVPRADLNYTGNFYASIFNQNIDRIQGYEVVNAQVQLNLRNDNLYLRAFVQNLTNNNAITGQYQADPSSGLFTNVFTLEPRRFGAAIGFKF